ALGLAAFGRDHVDVGVAGVLAAEGDPLAVGGEVRVAGLTLEAGDAAGGAARALDDPDVVGVGEGDVGGADGRAAEETGAGTGGAFHQGKGKGEGKEDSITHKTPEYEFGASIHPCESGFGRETGKLK